MLIDSLKDINNISDLFQYICNLETELEHCRKLNSGLRIMHDKMTNRILELQEQLAHTEATLEFYESKLTPKMESNDD